MGSSYWFPVSVPEEKLICINTYKILLNLVRKENKMRKFILIYVQKEYTFALYNFIIILELHIV